MKKLFNPAYWARALRNPIVLLGLLVDLLPIYAVLVWGWGAAPLVMLYWMENVIVGAATLPRIFISGASFGGLGLGLSLFLCVFFVFHYGLFCAVHGTFLTAFMSFSSSDVAGLGSAPVMDIPGMFRFGLQSGTHVDWMIWAIVGFQAVVFLWEFVLKGEWKHSNPMAEMFAPYGRIVVLHFGIFAGAAALFLLGEPMVGVLALILLRAVWGVVNNNKDGWDQQISEKISREDFAKALKGGKTEG